PAEEVRAARVSALIVVALAIGIGIAARDQNVAHLVALAFAVAASSNLPCVLLTLYWKRCNTGGIVLGMVGGALTAIVLVLVSPNMSYPLAETARAQQYIASVPAARAKLEAAALHDPAAAGRLPAAQAAIDRELAAAEATLAKYEGQTRSLVGLEAPLITLKNPGLYSIPVGFLLVLIGSLAWRDRRAEELWEELYVRQNTGIRAEGASGH
ncbi:MAG: sodium:solute symporter family transporter, partial [Gammaproteobacteria bacterium]